MKNNKKIKVVFKVTRIWKLGIGQTLEDARNLLSDEGGEYLYAGPIDDEKLEVEVSEIMKERKEKKDKKRR